MLPSEKVYAYPERKEAVKKETAVKTLRKVLQKKRMKKNLHLKKYMLSGAVLLSLGLTACGVKDSGGTIQSLSLEAYEPTRTAVGDTADTSDETSANDSTSTEYNAPADIPQSGTDTASAKVHYTLMIPDDFTSMDVESMECFYEAKDGSYINMNVQDKDPTFGELTADSLNSALSQAFSKVYNKEITLTNLSFSTATVSGYPSYTYKFSYEAQDTVITDLLIGIDADQTYTFTFCDMTGEWMALFEESASSLSLTLP